MEKFNVYIIEIASGKAVSLIGSNLSENKAAMREVTGLGRIDRKAYFVGAYEAGSDTDIALESSLKS